MENKPSKGPLWPLLMCIVLGLSGCLSLAFSFGCTENMTVEQKLAVFHQTIEEAKAAGASGVLVLNLNDEVEAYLKQSAGVKGFITGSLAVQVNPGATNQHAPTPAPEANTNG